MKRISKWLIADMVARYYGWFFGFDEPKPGKSIKVARIELSERFKDNMNNKYIIEDAELHEWFHERISESCEKVLQKLYH